MKKAAIITWICIGAWGVWQLPGVSNAAMLYFTLGINPVTHRSTPWPVTVTLLTLLVVVAVNVLFFRELRSFGQSIRLKRRQLRATSRPKLLPAQIVEREGLAVIMTPETTMTVAKQSSRRAPISLAHTLRQLTTLPLRLMFLLLLVTCQSLFIVLKTLTGLIGRFGMATWRLLQRLWPDVKQALLSLGSVLIFVIFGSWVMSVRLWSWFEPYARQFDAWLDRRLHAYEKSAFVLEIGESVGALLREWQQIILSITLAAADASKGLRRRT